MHITGGTITYLRRVKTGDYEHAEMSAVINFSFMEGEENVDTFIDRISSSAQRRVHGALGLPTPAAVPTASRTVAPPPAPHTSATPASPLLGTPGTKGKPGRPPSPATVAKREAEAKKAAEITEAIESPETAEAIEAPEPAEMGLESVEDFSEAVDVPPAKEVTDAELAHALQAKNASMIKAGVKDSAVRIRKLIGAWMPEGTPAEKSNSKLIPPGKREAFLKELSVLN